MKHSIRFVISAAILSALSTGCAAGADDGETEIEGLPTEELAPTGYAQGCSVTPQSPAGYYVGSTLYVKGKGSYSCTPYGSEQRVIRTWLKRSGTHIGSSESQVYVGSGSTQSAGTSSYGMARSSYSWQSCIQVTYGSVGHSVDNDCRS